MMNMRWYKRCLLGLVAIIVFCGGMLTGQSLPVKRPEKVVAAFSMSEEGAALPLPTPTPSTTELENWFAMEITPAPETSVATATPVGENGLPAEASVGLEPSVSKESTPTETPSFLIELVRDHGSETQSLQARPKRILIYHTHTYEAYQQAEADPYTETQQWRTTDERHNIVRVGEELAALLRGMGMEVVHDTTAFEPPDLNTSYARSLEMLEKRKELGESYDLYIDLHRDAYVSSQNAVNAVAVGDTSLAKIMLLIGKGEGQTSEGFEEKPPWQENLTIAQEITEELNGQIQGLCKEVRLKSGRFNQHIAIGCVLVEVGNNRNTLAEAVAAMPYLADAIVQTLQDVK